MDKWDDLTHRIQQGILAEEPEAAVAAAFDFLAEFGKTLDIMCSALDRIAKALEPVPEIPATTQEHDL